MLPLPCVGACHRASGSRSSSDSAGGVDASVMADDDRMPAFSARREPPGGTRGTSGMRASTRGMAPEAARVLHRLLLDKRLAQFVTT